MKSTLVFLTGFMGAGKSTLGPQLAQKLQWKFLDLDEVIEAKAGQTISEIFAKQGEAHFRDLESQALQQVCQSRHHVVALGGGALMREANFNLAKDHGLIIYLKASLPVLLNRLASERENRPLLRDTKPEELKAKLQKMMQEREPVYSQAHCIVDTDHLSIEQISQHILQRLDV